MHSFLYQVINYFADRNKNGGGLVFYINQDIPCKMVTSFDFAQNMEVLLIEINLNHSKFLIIGVYKPPSINNEIFLNELGAAISYYNV